MTAIRTRPVHGYSKFLSTGSARGSRVVTNEEMCTLIDSTPEWIEQRTGITERRWATDSETVVSMGATAARTALERSGLETSQIDAIIVATVSHHRPIPQLGNLHRPRARLGQRCCLRPQRRVCWILLLDRSGRFADPYRISESRPRYRCRETLRDDGSQRSLHRLPLL